jgi:hypothetical protein
MDVPNTGCLLRLLLGSLRFCYLFALIYHHSILCGVCSKNHGHGDEPIAMSGAVAQIAACKHRQ